MTTIYEFELPKGYLDEAGVLHKKGKMRLATAGDEISASRDPRVQNYPAYLTIALLTKVVVELEGIGMVTGTLIEQLYTADLTFLQNMYQRINDIEPPMMQVVCPECGHEFQVPVNFIQEG